jgi:Family of unknown function (DUF5694)
MNDKPTIFLIGTNHFANHDNGDLFQLKTDNILAKKRQQEIHEVIECLKTFRPTKVALEWPKEHQATFTQQYISYRNDNFQLMRNECYQIGFRLAKEMGHEEIFAVDWNHDLEGVPNLGTWTKENKSTLFEEIVATGQQQAVTSDNYFNHHPIKKFLLWLNSEKNIQGTQEIYMKLALVGTEDDPVGAKWTAHYWHYRNMLIYKNIMELATSSEDRIFVLYGAGHLPLLLQFFKESRLCNVEVASDYLA